MPNTNITTLRQRSDVPEGAKRRASLHGTIFGSFAGVIASALVVAASVNPVLSAGSGVKPSARDVTAAVFQVRNGERPNFSGQDLSELDLAGLNFKSADLAGANLYGTDLSSADLQGVNLSGSKLDRAVIIKSNFSGANLDKTSILKPSAFSTFTFDRADAPNFSRATLRGARISARMDGVSFRGADLTDAHFGPTDRSAEAGIAPSSRMMGADFTEAKMVDAKIVDIDLTFGRFVDANLRNAQLINLDLTRTDFSGADLTGANLSGSNLDDANLTGVKGFDTVTGLDSVKNLERARR